MRLLDVRAPVHNLVRIFVVDWTRLPRGGDVAIR